MRNISTGMLLIGLLGLLILIFSVGTDFFQSAFGISDDRMMIIGSVIFTYLLFKDFEEKFRKDMSLEISLPIKKLGAEVASLKALSAELRDRQKGLSDSVFMLESAARLDNIINDMERDHRERDNDNYGF